MNGLGVGPETLFQTTRDFLAQKVSLHFRFGKVQKRRRRRNDTLRLRHGAGVPGNRPRAPARGAVGPGGAVLFGHPLRRQARSGKRRGDFRALRDLPAAVRAAA
jgi:hypothetical protein